MSACRLALGLLVCAGALAVGSPAQAGGAKDRLHGAYGMTLSQTCVFPPLAPPPNPGFDPATGALLQPAEIVSATSTGIMRFADDGVVTLEQGVLSEIFQPRVQPGQVPVGARNAYRCAGPYTFADQRELSIDLTCDVLVPRPGVAIRITPFQLSGYVSRSRESINLAALEGNVQLLELSVDGQVVQTRERVCLQHLTLDRIRD